MYISFGWSNRTGSPDHISIVLPLAGLIGVIVFYLVILGVGLWAAWKNKKMREQANESVTAEDVILAKRNINLFVGDYQ